MRSPSTAYLMRSSSISGAEDSTAMTRRDSCSTGPSPGFLRDWKRRMRKRIWSARRRFWECKNFFSPLSSKRRGVGGEGPEGLGMRWEGFRPRKSPPESAGFFLLLPVGILPDRYGYFFWYFGALSAGHQGDGAAVVLGQKFLVAGENSASADRETDLDHRC